MKKTYIQPSVEIVRPVMEHIMIAASIQNIEGENQSGVEENKNDGFEAGGNGNNYGWEDDSEW